MISEELQILLLRYGEPEDELLQHIDRETQLKVLLPRMLSGHYQGRVLSMLSKMATPHRILEIGTFTGYATLCLAEGLSEDGLIYTLDINEELEDMVRANFAKSPLNDKIRYLIGDAQESLKTLHKETFDLVFIDADKKNNATYYNLVFDQVKPGGIIIVDNVLWSGKVLNNAQDKDTKNISAFNEQIAADKRVEKLILPVRDGLYIIRKILLMFFLSILSTFAVKAQTTEEYISTNAFHAQYLMQRYRLPASIILGIAIHESAAGKSKIAKHLNNHFGVKGTNSNAEIKSSYRDYPSVDSSYTHFVTFLQQRKYFNILFDKYNQYDYKNWINGIQRGGYASSRTWALQVIAIIKKYELFQYDNRPESYAETSIPLAQSFAKKMLSITKINKIYTVKNGDNLGAVAERNNTSVSVLMQKNGLKSSRLKLGQKIKL